VETSSFPTPRVSLVIILSPILASHTIRTIKKNIMDGCVVYALVIPMVRNPLILKNSRRMTNIIMWCHRLVIAIIKNNSSRGISIVKASATVFPLTVKTIKSKDKNKIIVFTIQLIYKNN